MKKVRKEMSNKVPTCFKYKKHGHIKVDCLNFKKKKFKMRLTNEKKK